jgi:hypothetical protein
MSVPDGTTGTDPGQAPRLAGLTHLNPAIFHRKAAKNPKETQRRVRQVIPHIQIL